MNFCEIDKYAVKSYCAIHGVSEQINLRDVSTVNTAELHDVNLITYGFPCQDISAAGHQKGFFDENGNVTRSGLFFAALKIIKDTKPEYAIAENVKALTSKKFTAEFATVLDSLEQAGYNNYYKVLNAKDFGIPQNRERVFIVSIRKDIDFKFMFPVGEPLKLRLADLLENEVDSKFYLSEEQINRIKTSSYHQNQRRIQSKECYTTLCCGDKRVLETENIAILCTKRTEYGKQIRKEYEEKKIKEKRSNMTCLASSISALLHKNISL